MKTFAKQAVILAAGRGTRLGDEYTNGLPKCLLQIGGRSLLSHQISALRAVGVKRVLAVTGHRSGEVEAHGHRLQVKTGVQMEFVENPDYATTNTIYSLYLARSIMDESFVLLNGDVLFDSRILDHLAQSTHDSVLATEVKPCGKEEVKAQVDEYGRIHHLGKKLAVHDALGEFVGIAQFGPLGAAALSKSLKVAVEDEQRRNDYFEYAIERIASKTPFHAIAFDSFPVVEIDFPEDYKRAVSEVLPTLKHCRITSEPLVPQGE